jgi:hypothetical protein
MCICCTPNYSELPTIITEARTNPGGPSTADATATTGTGNMARKIIFAVGRAAGQADAHPA